MTGVDLDDLPDATVRLDRDRRIVEVNQAALALLQAERTDLVGHDIFEALTPRGLDGEPLLAAGWHPSASLRGTVGIPEQEITVGIDSTTLRARVTGRYERDGDGTLTGALLALRPAKGRGRDEPTGSEVVSTVSHELRSPLTSVKGYTSLLLNRWDRLKDDQKKMMLEQVHHDADRVTRLITELLDISRLETGRLVLRRQMVDVPELAEQVVAKLTLTYPDLECRIDFPADFPRVYADPDKLEQVLTNLVENAAKYANPKGMVVAGTVGPGDPHEVEVAVSDAGEGIPEADLPKVFRKFFRRDLGKPTGTGLGLWISRGLVEAHGGRLTAESTEGVGSTFRFALPLLSVDDVIDGVR